MKDDDGREFMLYSTKGPMAVVRMTRTSSHIQYKLVHVIDKPALDIYNQLKREEQRKSSSRSPPRPAQEYTRLNSVDRRQSHQQVRSKRPPMRADTSNVQPPRRQSHANASTRKHAAPYGKTTEEPRRSDRPMAVRFTMNQSNGRYKKGPNSSIRRPELSPSIRYTERRVLAELDDVIREESNNRLVLENGHSCKERNRVPIVPPEHYPRRPSSQPLPGTQSALMSYQSTVRYPEQRQERMFAPAVSTTYARGVQSVPECVRTLKLHYRSGRHGREETRKHGPRFSDKRHDLDSMLNRCDSRVISDVDSDIGDSVSMVNNHNAEPSPYWNNNDVHLPYLRNPDSLNTLAQSLQEPYQDSLSKVADYIAARDDYQGLIDADGSCVYPGDYILISKPFLTDAIYTGNNHFARCVGNRIVREPIDAYTNIWIGSYSLGYAPMLSKEIILALAEQRIGHVFIGTNHEFIISCLTGMDSFEAFELGFRLHDGTGKVSSMDMPELF